MKTIKIAFPLLLCLLFFGLTQVEAQRGSKGDDQFFSNSKYQDGTDLFITNDMDVSKSFSVPVSSKKKVLKPSASVIKVLGLAPATKVLNTPMRVKSGNDCYEIRCSANACQGCKMLWKDINKDGKIQPKKEVRCVCVQTKELCKIEGKKVRCNK